MDYSISREPRTSGLNQDVEDVDSFVYLGSSIDAAGGSDLHDQTDPRRHSTVTHGILLLVCTPTSDFTMPTYF